MAFHNGVTSNQIATGQFQKFSSTAAPVSAAGFSYVVDSAVATRDAEHTRHYFALVPQGSIIHSITVSWHLSESAEVRMLFQEFGAGNTHTLPWLPPSTDSIATGAAVHFPAPADGVLYLNLDVYQLGGDNPIAAGTRGIRASALISRPT